MRQRNDQPAAQRDPLHAGLDEAVFVDQGIKIQRLAGKQPHHLGQAASCFHEILAHQRLPVMLGHRRETQS